MVGDVCETLPLLSATRIRPCFVQGKFALAGRGEKMNL
jgi:hypothetical protein